MKSLFKIFLSLALCLPGFAAVVSLTTPTGVNGVYAVTPTDFFSCNTVAIANGNWTVIMPSVAAQPQRNQCADIVNYGSGTVTIQRNGQLINNSVAALSGSYHIVSDGINFNAYVYSASSATGTVTQVVCGNGLTGGTIVTTGTCAGNFTLISQKFFGVAAPGSVTGNLPGDQFYDHINHLAYWCDAASGTSAPACNAVAVGNWTQVGSGSGGGSMFDGSAATSTTGIGGTASAPTFTTVNISGKSPHVFRPAQLTVDVTSVTITTSMGADFWIRWKQSAGTLRHVSGYANLGADSDVCDAPQTASKAIFQHFIVEEDGTTIDGVGCSSNDPADTPITVISGDGTTPGAGNGALTLSTVNSNVGDCGDATHVCKSTYDAKGRATAAVPVSISGGGATGTLTTPASDILSTDGAGGSTNTCASGCVYTPFATTLVIPANTLITGKSYRITAKFKIVASGSPPDFSFKINARKAGPTDVSLYVQANSATPTAGVTINTSSSWSIDGTAAAGASASVFADVISHANINNISDYAWRNFTTMPATLDTTAAQTITIQVLFTAATASNSIQLVSFLAEPTS